MANLTAAKKNRRMAWNGSKWITPLRRIAIYQRDDFKCVYCQRSVIKGVAQLDHVLAVELGGKNETSNLVTACGRCNAAKGAKSVGKFIQWLQKNGQGDEDLAGRIITQTSKPIDTNAAKAWIANRAAIG